MFPSRQPPTIVPTCQHRWKAALVLGVLAVIWAVPAPAAEKNGADGSGRLVEQLGSRKYGERRAAVRALDALGTAALPALTQASRSADPEVRRLALALVESIRRRDEMEKLLAPTLVHLVYKDTPVTVVVADLAKKTGFDITLEGDRGKLAGRKITLDTGKTTFWQAFDQVCQKARLAERGLVLAGAKTVSERKMAYGQPVPFAGKIRLRLHDAWPSALPTSYFLGVRVRALPASTLLEKLALEYGEKAIVLEATLEPKRRLYRVVSLSIHRAVDERGTDIAATTDLLPEEQGSPYQRVYYSKRYGGRPANYATRLQSGMGEGNFRRMLVKVKASGKLRELRGTLTAEVKKPAGAVFTVENVLKATGKSFRSPDGGTMTVSSASHQKSGTVTVQVDTNFPLGGAFGGIQIGNGVVRLRRGPGGAWETVGIDFEKLKLFDSAGKGFRLTGKHSTGMRFGPGGISQSMTLTYVPEKGTTEPARLVYFGEATAFVDVQFTLKNVKLP